MTTYPEFEQIFGKWAHTQPDIRSVVVVGSRARLFPPADEWSDLDLILFVTHPAMYATSPKWLSEIGEVWLPVLNQTGAGYLEWLVLFAGGLKADFVLMQAAGTLHQMLPNFPFQNVLRRGVRVLFDKEDAEVENRPFSLPPPPPSTPPTEAEFHHTIHQTLLTATRVARFLQRGDLWRAKNLADGTLKQQLLQMLEWHTQATMAADTWYDGRFLSQWADPRVLAALPATFALYDVADLWRGLWATLELFRWLAQETAEKQGYAYPKTADLQISQWIRQLSVNSGQ